MLENARKTLIYFTRWDSYWKLTDDEEKLSINPGKTGRYPLDFKPRIDEGHYPYFDAQGVPMWPKKNTKEYLYHYTTMFSYALGQSDYYLLTGKVLHLDKIVAVSDYIIKSGIHSGESLLLKEWDDDGNHTGNISAMTQGEAMSVLCKAYEFTGEEKYIVSAHKLSVPFTKTIEDGGVMGNISKIDSSWYEEYVEMPLNHVLNGMIYSVWGLRDLYVSKGNPEINMLWERGILWIKKALPLFDTGYWTYYWVPEKSKNYVASMMYHNLHICQLTALYRQTGDEIFKEYSDRFIDYTKSPINRFKAARNIFMSKLFT